MFLPFFMFAAQYQGARLGRFPTDEDGLSRVQPLDAASLYTSLYTCPCLPPLRLSRPEFCPCTAHARPRVHFECKSQASLARVTHRCATRPHIDPPPLTTRRIFPANSRRVLSRGTMRQTRGGLPERGGVSWRGGGVSPRRRGRRRIGGSMGSKRRLGGLR